jgi:hypothetical protein
MKKLGADYSGRNWFRELFMSAIIIAYPVR